MQPLTQIVDEFPHAIVHLSVQRMVRGEFEGGTSWTSFVNDGSIPFREDEGETRWWLTVKYKGIEYAIPGDVPFEDGVASMLELLREENT